MMGVGLLERAQPGLALAGVQGRNPGFARNHDGAKGAASSIDK
jgi:hypothetical protein